MTDPERNSCRLAVAAACRPPRGSRRALVSRLRQSSGCPSSRVSRSWKTRAIAFASLTAALRFGGQLLGDVRQTEACVQREPHVVDRDEHARKPSVTTLSRDGRCYRGLRGAVDAAEHAFEGVCLRLPPQALQQGSLPESRGRPRPAPADTYRC